jgi:hypothetical protein
MEKYMLLFRNTPTSEEDYQNLSPADMQAELAKWQNWIGGIAAQGRLIATDALQNSGKLVRQAGQVITDGPYVESKELVSGYLLCTAANMDQAIEDSKGCPIFEMDGTVEVRQIMDYGE